MSGGTREGMLAAGPWGAQGTVEMLLSLLAVPMAIWLPWQLHWSPWQQDAALPTASGLAAACAGTQTHTRVHTHAHMGTHMLT